MRVCCHGQSAEEEAPPPSPPTASPSPVPLPSPPSFSHHPHHRSPAATLTLSSLVTPNVDAPIYTSIVRAVRSVQRGRIVFCYQIGLKKHAPGKRFLGGLRPTPRVQSELQSARAQNSELRLSAKCLLKRVHSEKSAIYLSIYLNSLNSFSKSVVFVSTASKLASQTHLRYPMVLDR